MSEKSVLITGAAGFIGFHLAKRLLENGDRVIGFDDLNGYYDVTLKNARLELLCAFPGFVFVKGDLADANAVRGLFEQYHPETVVNLAAQAGVRYSITNPETYIQSNIVGFFNVLEACRAFPTSHLVYASSSSVYGNQQKTPFSETDSADCPSSLYAATKKSNELMAYTYSHLYGIPATGLRFFTVYGPFGRPDMAYFDFTGKIFAGEPIQLYNNGDLYRDFTYVDDIVSGVERLLDCPPAPDETGARAKVYNIGNNHPEKLTDFVAVLERLIGIPAKKKFLPMQPGDVYQTYADVSGLERDFGFKPDTPLERGLTRFVAWYKEYYSQNNSLLFYSRTQDSFQNGEIQKNRY